MDSKLVIEQMSGQLEGQAPLDAAAGDRGATGWRRSARTFTWVPREQNAHADRLANEALDGVRDADGPIAREPVEEDSGENAKTDPDERADPEARLGLPEGQADHADPGPARRHRRHDRQAVLRRPGEQQPAAERRGPGTGPGDRRVAGADGRAPSTRS